MSGPPGPSHTEDPADGVNVTGIGSRARQPATTSVRDERQVEASQAFRVGEHVDRDDQTAADRQ
jgi:hypothetical protein